MGTLIIDEFTEDLTLTHAQKHYRREQKKRGLEVSSVRGGPHNIIHDKYEGLGTAEWRHRKRNPDKTRNQKRNYSRRETETIMVQAARKRAKDQNVPCTINKNDISIPSHCPILNIELKLNVGKPKDDSPSLDKIIPSLGYVPGNVRVISYKANKHKSYFTRDYLQRLLDYVDGKI